MPVPNRVRERLVAAHKRLLPIIQAQKARDVSEADTVTLVKDLLSEMFGYDKYAELTSEHAIRGTYCDLAIRIEDKLAQLVEVKSAGTVLEDRHVKQAVDYSSNQGVEWVILTNGSVWRLYEVIFAKPIDKRLLAEFDLTQIEIRKEEHLQLLYLLTKEGLLRGEHLHLRDHQDATSRFLISSLLVNNDSVIGAIRRELRRVVDVLVDDDAIVKVLRAEVIKRDNLEGPLFEEATRRCCRAENRANKAKKATGRTEDAAGAPAEGAPAASDGDGSTVEA